MFEDLQVAVVLGITLGFMIGPVFFVLLETSATKGFRAGLSFDIGVILADVVFILIAYFSSYQLIENLSNQPGLYVLGGAIIIVYGITLFFKKEKQKERFKAKKGNYIGLLVKGFLLNFINIGVLVFWLVIIIVVVPSLDNDEPRILRFFITVLCSYLFIDILKILLAKQLRKKLTDERILLAKKVLGIVLVVCGAVMIIKGFVPYDMKRGIDKMEYRIKK